MSNRETPDEIAWQYLSASAQGDREIAEPDFAAHAQ